MKFLVLYGSHIKDEIVSYPYMLNQAFCSKKAAAKAWGKCKFGPQWYFLIHQYKGDENALSSQLRD